MKLLGVLCICKSLISSNVYFTVFVGIFLSYHYQFVMWKLRSPCDPPGQQALKPLFH